MEEIRHDISRFTDYDIYLFKEGNHFKLYEKLGSHLMKADGKEGAYFALWAPNAERVSVVGGFNDWKAGVHPLAPRLDGSGIWEGFIPGIKKGDLYKYYIESRYGYKGYKADPLAFFYECPPKTASVVWDLDYPWKDESWIEERKAKNSLDAPISVYEVHLGSWRRVPEKNWRMLTYRELAPPLADYVEEMGFTHVEFLPVMEHPLYDSWGYEVTGYFAPSARQGAPQDFMFLVDYLHRRGIGVFLDWVPSHFPMDDHALFFFDGSHLYEHADPRKGIHPEWHTAIFNYGRYEVRNFLISNALFWLDKYRADGLRIDAVASMLYLDYSRKEGEWIPNQFGGKENLEAIAFLRRLNEVVFANFPHVQMIGEESTAWPMVTRPTYVGGLGFSLKWKMGWMHDTLFYLSKDPIYRKYHHELLTFSMWYAYSENFLLPLSHDEVVHGKKPLLEKMPGDDWQKFANLRLLFAYMYSHPGKKLLFMGGEFGQRREWTHRESLDWHLLQHESHSGVQRWVRDLNHFYRSEPAMYALDFDPRGYEWIDFKDWEQSVISYLRRGKAPEDLVLVVLNFTPVPRHNYRVGAPRGGFWRERLNSDAEEYWGSGVGNSGGVWAENIPFHDQPCSLSLTLPPLGALFLKPEG